MQQNVASEPSFDEIIAGAKRDIQLSRQSYARFKAVEKKHWEQLVGEGLEEWLNSREKTEVHLADSNPRLRQAALVILLDHWKPDARLAAESEKLAFSDSDTQVRGVALLVLSGCFQGSKDARIGRLLAGVVCDASQPVGFRKNAYFGLFQLRGLPVEIWPDPTVSFREQDVDWDFVRTFGAADSADS